MKNIYVGNISFGTTEASLRSIFEPFGQVDRVNVVIDPDSGQARGFAFVEMPVDSEAMAAMAALNNTDLDGRTLTVNEAKAKTDRPAPSRGGRQKSRR